MPPRQRVFRTESVVLRRFDFGEADRILTLYTPDMGKLRAIGKGIRRPGSRKSGHLEPFTRVNVLLAKGREIDIITQAEAVDHYVTLRQNLDALGTAAYAVELLDGFTVDGVENRPLYSHLIATLERLSQGDSAAPALRYFELRLLDLSGYRPELFHCVSCRKEIRPEDQYFSSADGGVVCPQCGGGRRDVRPISLASLKVLRHYQRHSYEVIAPTRIRASVHTELETLLSEYLSYLLERKLHSPAFLQMVRHLEHNHAEPDPID